MKTAPTPLAVVGAEGRHIHLADGRKLLDGLASWWTACHGYRHPYLVEKMRCQLEALPHIMLGGLQHEQAALLASRLAKLLPGDLNHVFFCDSGSVAVEVALKMAVQFWMNQGEQKRHRFICFQHGYHGDTLAAMSVCDPHNGMHAHFHGYVPEQFSSPIPKSEAEWRSLEELLRTRKSEIAGLIIEPLIQGAGGMKFHSPADLARIASLTREAGILFIADEIAVGFGRTGGMFACEKANVQPDIVCLGKGLTGGMMTLAATVASERVFEAFWSDNPYHALMHGPTYMANPLACAAANASLDLFQTEPRLEQVRAIEGKMLSLLARCKDLPGVLDVRVLGAVAAIELVDLRDNQWLRDAFLRRDIWLRPFANAVYATPSYTITNDELDCLGNGMCDVVEEWSTRCFRRRIQR